jgi:hypothetical protein
MRYDKGAKIHQKKIAPVATAHYVVRVMPAMALRDVRRCCWFEGLERTGECVPAHDGSGAAATRLSARNGLLTGRE